MSEIYLVLHNEIERLGCSETEALLHAARSEIQVFMKLSEGTTVRYARVSPTWLTRVLAESNGDSTIKAGKFRYSEVFQGSQSQEVIEFEGAVRNLWMLLFFRSSDLGLIERNKATGAERRSTPQELQVSPDNRSINYKGKSYSLTRGQAEVFKFLHDQWLYGTPEVSQATIAVECGLAEGPQAIRNLFKNSDIWKDGLVSKGRTEGTVRLNIS